MPSPAVISVKVAAGLRRHNQLSWLIYSMIALAACSISADHVFDHGDDWNHFSHQQVVCVSAIDGESIGIQLNASDIITPVHLLGVTGCNPRWDQKARDELDSQLAGRKITLQLEKTQTRDEKGRLLAYAFLDDRTTINAEIVRQGMALADRRVTGEMLGAIEQAETEARKKHRGLWRSIQPSELPAWRCEWMAQEDNRRQKIIAAVAAP